MRRSARSRSPKVTREAPSRIPFLLKDPRGHADFYAALARHDAKGSANTMRSFQGGRPSIYTLTDAIRKVPTPALIICGDEDDNCIEPSMFLKKHLPAAGLAFFPKAGHVLNLEEPALFNDMVERFVKLVEAGTMAGARSPVDGARTGLTVIASASEAVHVSPMWIASSLALLAMTAYFSFPARLSRNTPCSPNMFQNHQGMFTRSGRP